MKTIGAGIVTFNPDIERLRENIHSIINQISILIISDNGSENINEIEELISQYNNIVIIKNYSNIGIAAALNKIFNYAYSSGYQWVLTLDQDSVCPENMVEELYKNNANNVGIICPLIWDINRKNNVELLDESKNIKRCITSGALTSVKAWKEIEGFDEKMFIDGVDFDFCDRLILANYLIVEVHKIALKHEIGHISYHKFLMFKVAVKNHSAFRKYYIAKNIVYLDRKNKLRSYPIKTILRLSKQIALVILYEDDKAYKLRNIIKGAKAGFKENINYSEMK